MATITPKEKDGKIIAYKFRACVGRDENGRQVSRATTWQVPENLSMVRLEKAVQRAAADWEKQARAEYEKDLYDPERVKAREVDRTKTDFARFVLEEWFPICIDNGERKPKTVSFYHDTTKNIVAHFQGQIVQKISAPAIQKFLIYLRTEKGFAPQNVHHHYRTLNMIFAYAMRQELIAKNPMDKVDRPKLSRKKVDALTQDEAKAFFAALQEQPLDFRCLLHLLIHGHTAGGVYRPEMGGRGRTVFHPNHSAERGLYTPEWRGSWDTQDRQQRPRHSHYVNNGNQQGTA